jgi:hypothetical protein
VKPPPTHVRVRCDSCHGAVELECQGLEGWWGYDSYNEYLCPHCDKKNQARCSGPILGARPALPTDVTAPGHFFSGTSVTRT